MKYGRLPHGADSHSTHSSQMHLPGKRVQTGFLLQCLSRSLLALTDRVSLYKTTFFAHLERYLSLAVQASSLTAVCRIMGIVAKQASCCKDLLWPHRARAARKPEQLVTPDENTSMAYPA
jgi:hypothetical protein